MSFDLSLLSTSLDRASALIAGIEGKPSVFDELFGAGALQLYANSSYGTSAAPFAEIGITLLEGSVMGDAAGAFASKAHDGAPEIFLNSSWLEKASTDAITGVLLEEYGHAIDWIVNGTHDTAGDEGWRFAVTALGGDTALGEGVRPAGLLDDHGTLQIDGQAIAVEFAITTTFTGWTQTLNGGAINLSNSDQTATITGKDSGGGAATTTLAYPGTLPTAGFVKFSWSTTNTDADSDLFQYSLGGTTVLASTSGSGSVQRSFYTAPADLSFSVVSDGGVDGTHTATISQLAITPFSDIYHTKFESIFSATGSANKWTPTARLDVAYPGEIYVFPDNPISDADYSSNFVSNGSTNTVWVMADCLGPNPVQMYLTNGENRLGSGGSVEEIWMLNTQSNGGGTAYMVTSGGLTPPTVDVEQNINSSVTLASLDNLYVVQSGGAAPTISISNSTVRGSNTRTIASSQTATVTFDLSEASPNFSEASVTVTGGSLSNWTKVNATRYIAQFNPDGTGSNGVISVSDNKFSNASGIDNSDGADANNTTTILVSAPTPPTAEIRPAASSVQPGAISTALVSLSEASNTFSQSDISANVAIRRFRKISDSLYEITFVAPRSGVIDLAVSVGSFSNLSGGTPNIGHPEGLDRARINVLTPNAYNRSPVETGTRGLTSIVVGRSAPVQSIAPAVTAPPTPLPIPRSARTAVFTSRFSRR